MDLLIFSICNFMYKQIAHLVNYDQKCNLLYSQYLMALNRFSGILKVTDCVMSVKVYWTDLVSRKARIQLFFQFQKTGNTFFRNTMKITKNFTYKESQCLQANF